MTRTSNTQLRLGPLPKTEVAKMTITVPVTLKQKLERYAALHSQTYGEQVDAATLIPHMLEAFMARDRSFKKSTGGMAGASGS